MPVGSEMGVHRESQVTQSVFIIDRGVMRNPMIDDNRFLTFRSFVPNIYNKNKKAAEAKEEKN